MPAAFSGCTVERLNASRMRHPALPPEASTAAVDELTRDRSAMSLEAANREVYLLLKEGIRVSVADTKPSPRPSPRTRRRGRQKRRTEGGAVARD